MRAESAASAKFVAVVDDDESIRSALIPALESVGLPAFGFASAKAFMTFGRLAGIGCLVTDVKMPGMSGLELQAKLQRAGYRIPTVFIAGCSDATMRAQALAAGADAFFDKPFDDRVLLATVRTLFGPPKS